jgi:hypothetical protein
MYWDYISECLTNSLALANVNIINVNVNKQVLNKYNMIT